MKVYSIGRNQSADFYFEDPMVSRRHAALRVHTFGKIEVIDYSQNGTFVNSRRIKPNVFYPVKRGDEISFAGNSYLDWSAVRRPYVLYLAVGAAVILLILAVIVCVSKAGRGHDLPPEPVPIPVEDSTAVQGGRKVVPAPVSPKDSTDYREIIESIRDKETPKDGSGKKDRHRRGQKGAGSGKSGGSVDSSSSVTPPAEVPEETGPTIIF